MRLPKFQFFAPKTIEAAVSMLSEKEGPACVLAGGTDVVVKMTLGRLQPKTVIGLEAIEGLREIQFDDKRGLSIGAMSRLVEVSTHPAILKYYPALAYAVSVMANVQVRNMGTVAGNLCNAAPSADSAPPLMAMGAEVVLTSTQGERRLPLDSFFKGPGMTAMESGEIMTSILVPLPLPQSGASYHRISARCGVDIAAVGVGVMAAFDGRTCKQAKIVLGAVAPTPIHAMQAEAMLQGREWTPELIAQVANQAVEESKPISDVRASVYYRKKMVGVLTGRALEEALARAGAR